MITIRFGRWSRLFYGKFAFRRIRFAGLWTPFVIKKPIVKTKAPMYDALNETQMHGFQAYLHGASKSKYHSPKKAKRNKTRADKTKPSKHGRMQ